MNTRFLIRLLTLTSWIPLVSCASSDDGKDTDATTEKAADGKAGSAAEGEENENSALDGDLTAGGDEDLGDEEEPDSNSAKLMAEDEASNSTDDNFDSEDESSANAKSEDSGNSKENSNVATNANSSDTGLGAFDNLAGPGDFATNSAFGGADSAVAGTDSASDAFKNTAIDTDPVAIGGAPDNLFADAPAATPVPTPVPSPPPPTGPIAPIAPIAAAIATTQELPGHDVEATSAKLFWVGYKISEAAKKLNVEIIAKGNPEYEIFQQENRLQQTELIIRFYHTSLRHKLRWDVNSSEFRSPVAYIRMKEKHAEGSVDLVITHREKIEPLFYERDGNFLLSYAIPDHYSAPKAKVTKKIKDRAISLSSDRPLAKPVVTASKLPEVGFPRYAAQFKDKPDLKPIGNFLSRGKPVKIQKDGLPDSFSRAFPVKQTGQILSRTTLSGVAQDDVEENSGGESSNNSGNGNSANSEKSSNDGNSGNSEISSVSNGNGATDNVVNGNAANGSAASGNAANGNAANGNRARSDDQLNDASGAGDLGGESNGGSDPDAFSDFDDKAESGGSGNGNGLDAALEEPPTPATTAEPMVKEPAAQEVEPQESAETKGKYTGKPIFMDLYDSPLSLVLKGFSEETGNNFVFPAEVGAVPVTIHFKGVPWDEALKAILETYSLGMVRIGENVVRVDKISSLTGYMQELETAKQFETRRVPTKVMIYRVNNGVAKTLKDQILGLLARDIQVDNRIKVSDDDRTNSVVIEAPTNVLAKARAIIQRLDLETPQVEITSRVVEVQKSQTNFFGVAWGNNVNFDPGRGLGFGSLNFPNSLSSAFSVDPGVAAAGSVGQGRFRFGSLNKFLDLDLLLKMEEKKGNSDVLQSNRVLVLDGKKATVLSGSSQFFRPAAGGNVINPGAGTNVGATGLSEITFNLLLEVTPQVTALGNVIMDLLITSDTPGPGGGETLASKNSRKLNTQMVRGNGETGVIGGIYDTKRTEDVSGIPFLSDIPIIGALFRSTSTSVNQTELLIMVTPTIVSGPSEKIEGSATAESSPNNLTTIISQKNSEGKGKL